MMIQGKERGTMSDFELYVCPGCVKMERNFKLREKKTITEYSFYIIKKGSNKTLYVWIIRITIVIDSDFGNANKWMLF